MSKPKIDERSSSANEQSSSANEQSSSSNKNIQIPTDVLKNLLTPSEWRMLKNRFQIMNLLEEGLSIRKIAKKVKVGTDTVVRVIRMLEKYPKAKKINTETAWIFGKSS